MSERLLSQVQLELEQLSRLIATHRELIEKCKTVQPSDIELSALAAMLHSYYCGIENLWKRISIECDEQLPQGPQWHRDLLAAMAKPGPRRPAAIPDAMRSRLRAYLDFRHVFRQAYSFDLRWEKMSSLVLDAPALLDTLSHELSLFCKALQGTSKG